MGVIVARSESWLARGDITIMRVVRRWWLWIVGVVVVVVANVFSQVGFAWAFKDVVNALVLHSRHGLMVGAAIFAALAVAQPATGGILRVVRQGFGARVAQHIRIALVRHVAYATMSSHDRWRSGDVETRVAGDVDAVAGMVSGDLINLIHQPLLMLTSFAYLLTLSVPLALTVAVLGPALLLLSQLSGPRLYKASRDIREASSRVAERTLDLMGAIVAIKAMSAEDRVVDRIVPVIKEQYESLLRRERLGAVLDAAGGWLMLAPFVMIWWFGGEAVLNGHLSLGVLAAAVQLMNYVVGPFGGMAGGIRGIQAGQASLSRLNEVLQSPTEGGVSARFAVSHSGEGMAKAPEPSEMRVCGDGGEFKIELRGVCFRYAGQEKDVLSGVSVGFPSGVVTALLGPNGVGKSTLLKLLLGLYHPHSGSMWWQGNRIDGEMTPILRRGVAFVPQEPFLIDGTVAENLALATPDASQGEMDRVCARVGLEGSGLTCSSPVGERGKLLSGGQRLRISLARALLADAECLLLDEPSAGLDAEGVAVLMSVLRECQGSRTVVVVTHDEIVSKYAACTIMLKTGGTVEMQPGLAEAGHG